MKSSDYSILAVFTLIVLSSCGAGKTESESANQDPTAAEAGNQRPVLYLEGMYATSTRSPLDNYSLANIFDGKSETYWSTIRGAGPDEGFVLYFPSKQFVREIHLNGAKGENLATIKEVSVYADGQRLGNFDPGRPIKVDKDLISLFIKIGTTDRSNTEDILSEDSEHDITLERFDSNHAVGIADIKILNADGEMAITPPLAMRGSVVASSVLEPENAYAASQLFDSRKEFVWAEGAKGGGENEKLTFTFADPQTISSIKIWNGYQRSEKHYESNARIKSFEFGAKNGTKAKYSLEDESGPKTLKLIEPLKGAEFELTVLEVYPGTNYKDLAVSEIVFYDEATPVIIKDDKTEEIAKAFIAETKGSVLENYIDRRLHNGTNGPYYSFDKSLILRSNKTFVLYDHTVSSDDAIDEDKEVVADGNWEIVEQGDGFAKVRIFGKLRNLAETVDFYKGNTSTEFVKIFQDNLHITAEKVKGEKHVDVFYNKLPEPL